MQERGRGGGERKGRQLGRQVDARAEGPTFFFLGGGGCGGFKSQGENPPEKALHPKCKVHLNKFF